MSPSLAKTATWSQAIILLSSVAALLESNGHRRANGSAQSAIHQVKTATSDMSMAPCWAWVLECLSVRPFPLLISRNQARLRPRHIGWIIRTPKPIDERASTRELGVTVDQDHGCVHYTVSASIWLVSFMDYDLGYFDDETCRLEPLQTPSGQKCYLCLRYDP